MDYGGREERSDRFTEIEDRFAGYNVYDPHGERIGKVDDLFVNQMDEPEYIGVKMGVLGTRSTLIPWSICTVDEANQRIEAAVDKDKAKDGPTFDDDQEITPEYEEEVHRYYGVEHTTVTQETGPYGAYYSDEERPDVVMGDTESGEFREHPPEQEGIREPESDLEDEDELRVQRSEEELRAGTREREAGQVQVRKRVVTDREQVPVTKRREEVHVDRVPAEGEVTEAEIGEDEIRVPVTEEEAVVEKRPVKKEEIRIRKDVAQDEEIVEEDVRREEVEVDDETERRNK